MKFEDLYIQYLSDVYKFLLKLCGNPDLAEELTQETFTKAYENIENFRGTCKLSVWLCQIAKNTYFTYYERQKKQMPLQMYEENEEHLVRFAAVDSTEERVLDFMACQEIDKILYYLPEPYKEVFIMRVIGDLSFREISEAFGKTESWGRVTYYRAKAMIRERLEGGRKDER